MDYCNASKNREDAIQKFGKEAVELAELRNGKLFEIDQLERLSELSKAYYDAPILEAERQEHLEGIPQT